MGPLSPGQVYSGGIFYIIVKMLTNAIFSYFQMLLFTVTATYVFRGFMLYVISQYFVCTEVRNLLFFFLGNSDVFTALIGASGKDVLYIGDHIYGDILKSKKTRGWRTFLIVPELQHEVQIWTTKSELFQRIQDLEVQLGDTYR